MRAILIDLIPCDLGTSRTLTRDWLQNARGENLPSGEERVLALLPHPTGRGVILENLNDANYFLSVVFVIFHVMFKIYTAKIDSITVRHTIIGKNNKTDKYC